MTALLVGLGLIFRLGLDVGGGLWVFDLSLFSTALVPIL